MICMKSAVHLTLTLTNCDGLDVFLEEVANYHPSNCAVLGRSKSFYPDRDVALRKNHIFCMDSTKPSVPETHFEGTKRNELAVRWQMLILTTSCLLVHRLKQAPPLP